MSDKYEERNYEENIKKNLAQSISQKLILRLSIPQWLLNHTKLIKL